MDNLTHEQKKMLTEEVLGEKFMPGLVGVPYSHEGIKYSNRSFTTAQDMVCLCRALSNKYLWIDFCANLKGPDTVSIWGTIITDPPRTIRLIAEWWEKERIRE